MTKNNETLQTIPDLLDIGMPTDLTEELRQAGYHYISGVITDESLQYIQQDLLLRWHNNFSGTVNMLINSPGGELAATFALVNLMELMPFQISTISLGLCGSAATYIAAAGTKGARFATEDTLFLFHRFWSATDGTHPQLLAQVDGWDKEHDRDVRFWTKHSKYKSVKQVETELLQKEDKWTTAEQAMDMEVIDGIIRPRRKTVIQRAKKQAPRRNRPARKTATK